MSRLLYIIAGEPSGDRLGADLMAALKAEDAAIRFVGLGGREMIAQGLDPLFDISELSVMGVAEVVPRLAGLLRRISETTADVLKQRPDALITIDSPSFSLRVAERARKALPEIRTVHYVAPSVWAWRPRRAQHMARFIDHVLALLPFEPAYMEAAGMTCDFVGHPVASALRADPAKVASLRAKWTHGQEMPCLLVAPGSRAGEIARMMPLFRDVLGELLDRGEDVCAVIPVAETVLDPVRDAVEQLPIRPILVLPDEGEEAKRLAFAACDAALVASGTITLEMAAARTPMVACYRTSWLTAAIVRRVIKVDTANLINLIAGEKIVPEFLQEFATIEAVSNALEPLLDGTSAERNAQLDAFDVAMTTLGGEGPTPPQRAAASVLRVLT
ncbi:MAG: lipid-A-disaccharide synthase [Pseudomonadota bacterium]